MYGTQAAADGWQQEYASHMVKLGFKQGAVSSGKISSCVPVYDVFVCNFKTNLYNFTDNCPLFN